MLAHRLRRWPNIGHTLGLQPSGHVRGGRPPRDAQNPLSASEGKRSQ